MTFLDGGLSSVSAGYVRFSVDRKKSLVIRGIRVDFRSVKSRGFARYVDGAGGVGFEEGIVEFYDMSFCGGEDFAELG